MIRALLITLLLLFCSCTPKTNYLEGNTQVTIEYFGELEYRACSPNLTCEIKNNPECVSLLYGEVKRSAEKGLLALRDEDYSEAAFQFSFSLCNALGIDKIFDRMKSDNHQAWKTFHQRGFIEHVRLTALKLSILADECEKLLGVPEK
tara:strand:- start:35405 stop:35848 length:444 start_codon:yes stop_codon:yes gene_type:complete